MYQKQSRGTSDPPASIVGGLARPLSALDERQGSPSPSAQGLPAPAAGRTAAGAERFAIDIPGAVLRDLRARLARVRWPDHVPGNPWHDGTDLDFLRRLVEYWEDEFDWRAQERTLNTLPHFRATVSGERIHFIHVRGRGPHPTPLVLTHGWPGSFLEYRKIIPLLTDPAAHGGNAEDAFDVVIPSLPGYGFSDRPHEPGMHVERIASLWVELMTDVLGYDRFGAHGSDIGASVSTLLGLIAPERLLGVHLTAVTGSAILRWLGDGARPLTDTERSFREQVEQWTEAEGGYSHLQRTKPQTIAYALTDSPIGLASWIVEKYRAWSDCAGDVERRFSFDDLLSTVTLYWATGTIGSSMRLYYEGRKHPRRLAPGERVEVPCAAALFPKDIARPPREWGERAYRIVRWTEMPRGGHFPAHEEPELLTADLREFFRDLRV